MNDFETFAREVAGTVYWRTELERIHKARLGVGRCPAGVSAPERKDQFNDAEVAK